jgi:SAM-dependent methyltransferase
MPRAFDPSQPERMDLPQPVSPELDRDLANLRALNRWFGGINLVLRFARQWLTPAREWNVLDLATGSGDIPRKLIDDARARNVRLRIDAVDFQCSTIEIARSLSRDFPEIIYHHADILTFDLKKRWDLVVCSLALHHFSDAAAIRVLRRCAGLSSRFVLVTDLRRCLLGTWGVHLLTTTIMRHPMTVHDARASVHRAFSFAELRDLAIHAGWHDFGHRRFPCARQAIWLAPFLPSAPPSAPHSVSP